MRNTCSKRSYKCECGTINECYVWESDLVKHKVKCNKCEKSLGYDQLNIKKTGQFISIRTPTKNR